MQHRDEMPLAVDVIRTLRSGATPREAKLQLANALLDAGPGSLFPHRLRFLLDWLCGGLQYQVEHHLFPSLPRHNLSRAHEFVKSFCKQWDVSFHETDIYDGTIEVLHHLANVSDQFVVDFVQDGPTM